LHKIQKIDSVDKITVIKKATLFIKNKNNIYYDSSLNYLSSLGDTPGYGLTQYWAVGIKKIPLLFFLIFKDFLRSFYIFDYSIKGKIRENYETIIVSYSKFKNFKKNGSYIDTYFSTNSNYTKKCLWFLIHLDKKIPKKISDNVIIIYRNKPKFNFSKFFIFIINIPKIIYNFTSILHKQSFQTIVAHKIYEKFKFFLNINVKKIFLPYEGQPSQNLILKRIKDFKKNINTFGFIHNFPPPLPTNLIFRNGSPDKLIVSGKSQKNLLTKYLNWNNKKIILSQSARFINSNKYKSNTIFLGSYLFLSKKIIVEKLKFILLNINELKDKIFLIKNHPDKTKSKVHLALIKEIKKLLNKNKSNNIPSNNYISIVIGATGVAIESLERGCEVIHIAKDPLFESYCNKLYPNISRKIICENIYRYKITKEKLLINFGKKNLTFKNYLKY